MKVIGRQATDIRKLETELEDVRGLINTGNQARGDLAAKLGDLVTICRETNDTVERIVAGDDARDDTISSIQDAVKALADGRTADQKALGEVVDTIGKTVAELTEKTQGRFKAVDANGMETAQQIERIDGLVAELASRGDGLAERLDLADEADRAAGERTDALRKDVVEAGAKLLERIDDVAGNVAAVVKGRAEDREAIDAVRDAVEGVQQYAAKCFDAAMQAVANEAEARAENVTSVCEDITKLTDTVNREGKTLDDLAGAVERLDKGTVIAVAAVTNALGELTERVGAVEAFGERLDDVTGTVAAADRGRADLVKRVDDISTRMTETAAAIDVCTRDQAETHKRLDEVVDAAVARAGVEMKALTASVSTHLAAIEATDQRAADMLRRVTILIDQLPSGMMIDKDGELVRVARNGETVKIGKVTAVNGRDGVRGKDAAEIVAARVEADGRLMFTRSDRTEFGCALTAVVASAPQPAAIDPTKLGHLSKDPKTRAVQVADMIAMRMAEKPARYKAIAEKYKISERQAARLIKGMNDDGPSETI